MSASSSRKVSRSSLIISPFLCLIDRCFYRLQLHSLKLRQTMGRLPSSATCVAKRLDVHSWRHSVITGGRFQTGKRLGRAFPGTRFTMNPIKDILVAEDNADDIF